MSSQIIPIQGTPFELEFEFANDKFVYISIRDAGLPMKRFRVQTKLFRYLDFYEEYLRNKGILLDWNS